MKIGIDALAYAAQAAVNEFLQEGEGALSQPLPSQEPLSKKRRK